VPRRREQTLHPLGLGLHTSEATRADENAPQPGDSTARMEWGSGHSCRI
jgi:hypothetical protein